MNKKKKIIIASIIIVAAVTIPISFFVPRSLSAYLLFFKPNSISISYTDYDNNTTIIMYADEEKISDCFKDIKKYKVSPVYDAVKCCVEPKISLLNNKDEWEITPSYIQHEKFKQYYVAKSMNFNNFIDTLIENYFTSYSS